ARVADGQRLGAVRARDLLGQLAGEDADVAEVDAEPLLEPRAVGVVERLAAARSLQEFRELARVPARGERLLDARLAAQVAIGLVVRHLSFYVRVVADLPQRFCLVVSYSASGCS